jgi:hypothetical protein
MRHVMTLVLVALMGGFVAVVWSQQGDRPANATSPTATTGSGSAATAAGGGSDATPAASITLHRPVRTIALGWEWLAPGVVASAGTGSASGSNAQPSGGTFKAAGLEASFADATSMADVEGALAKGGEAGGADIAIVPLASYVASYERLRALAPEVAFVIGWSRGREALFSTDLGALSDLPPAGPVRLAATTGQPETLHALFLLDLAGVPASRVELGDRGSLSAVFRSPDHHAPGKLLLTSADTPHLMPVVAVVPHGFIQSHTPELEAWCKVWLAGAARLASDVPAGGRQVAAMPGAPEVLSIIEALGQVEFANLRDNATALGLSGRGALSLAAIYKTTWQIWRDVGVITTPPPESVPMYSGLVASLARAEPAALVEAAPSRARADDAKRPAVLLVIRATPGKDGKLEGEAFVDRIGFVAGVFDRLPLRVSVKDQKTAELLVGMARDRFGLRADQLVTGTKLPAGAVGAIEVLSAR